MLNSHTGRYRVRQETRRQETPKQSCLIFEPASFLCGHSLQKAKHITWGLYPLAQCCTSQAALNHKETSAGTLSLSCKNNSVWFLYVTGYIWFQIRIIPVKIYRMEGKYRKRSDLLQWQTIHKCWCGNQCFTFHWKSTCLQCWRLHRS